MVEQTHREGVAPRRGDVLAVGGEVADHLIDAVNAKRGEMIAQRAEITLAGRYPSDGCGLMVFPEN
jgi:hypothetical protein